MRLLLLLAAAVCALQAQEFDLVIANGHVMDPESGLNAVRNVGIRDGKIAAISAMQLVGRDSIPARNLIVAPGFIEIGDFAAADVRAGVTTVLDLDRGAASAIGWYHDHTGKSLVNFGVSAGYGAARAAAVRGETAGGSELKLAFDSLRESLQAGALGIGAGFSANQDIPRQEIFTLFSLAAERKAPVYLRLRGGDPLAALQEAIADAAATGASVRILNLDVSAGRQTGLALQMIDGAHRHGVDIEAAAKPELNPTLMEALRARSFAVAERLRLPGKGRIKEGADADLIVFSPDKPEAMRHVIVSGVPVVRDSELRNGIHPGKAIRR
jgi:N-acyl-D-aspartate/D-glutamate deacylase